MRFFTADLHLGHKNILAYCDRPFETVEKMDEALLENINQTVDIGDLLYILGDFCFGEKHAAAYLDKIYCQHVILVMGNHDAHTPSGEATKSLQDDVGFLEVRDLMTVTIETPDANLRAVLCHYPIETWRGKNTGYLHLHGHTHGLVPSEGLFRMDVGVDGTESPEGFRSAGDYKPYSEQDIVTYMTQKGIV